MADADAKKNPPNPKARYGDMKRRVDLVPPALELGAAVALAEGAAKYGPFNWRTNHVEAMTYVGAMKRHLAAYADGEDVDPESKTGKLHLEGIAACCAILLDSYYAGILIDNRPAWGPGPMLTRLPGAAPAPAPTRVQIAERDLFDKVKAALDPAPPSNDARVAPPKPAVHRAVDWPTMTQCGSWGRNEGRTGSPSNVTCPACRRAMGRISDAV